MISPIIVLVMYFLSLEKIANLLLTITFSTLFLLFVYFNYKMFIIASSKRENEAVVNANHEERRVPKLQSKMFSTCFLTVICYFTCTCPRVIYSALRLTLYKKTPFHEIVLHQIWGTAFVSMSSTFNCLIFFWRNSILRREGMNAIKCFWTTSS